MYNMLGHKSYLNVFISDEFGGFRIRIKFGSSFEKNLLHPEMGSSVNYKQHQTLVGLMECSPLTPCLLFLLLQPSVRWL